jgi:acyl-CoA reductase-like NAD-dependent aldehyde dehydrogenase
MERIIGPLINRKAIDRIIEQIESAKKKQGAEVVLEGKVGGNVKHPYILIGSNNVVTAQSEMFGPVATTFLLRVMKKQFVLNDTPFGQSVAVHAGSRERGIEVAKQITSVWIM